MKEINLSKATVLIQGGHGSFHEMAAEKLVPESSCLPALTFHEVFSRLKLGEADYAVVANINSNFGDIDPMYRELTKMAASGDQECWIIGAHILNVDQYLIGLQGAKLQDIKHVHSMAPAIGQCSEYLDQHLPSAERIEENDTAESVRLIMRKGEKSRAAIASSKAAKLFGGNILARSIQNDRENKTRFILLSPEPVEVADTNKVSLIMETGNVAGSLYHALGVFAELELNLCYLRSQAIPGANFRQMFYVDLEIEGEDQRLKAKQALKLLELQNVKVTVLGFYKESRDK